MQSLNDRDSAAAFFAWVLVERQLLASMVMQYGHSGTGVVNVVATE